MKNNKATNYRWIICSLLFLATAINYMDRQVLSLTWKDFIAPEFHWTDSHYGYIAATFSIIYAIANIFAGRIIDWLGTKKGYLTAIFIWSVGACLHALCGYCTEWSLGIKNASEMINASAGLASMISITSVYFFIAARIVLAVGESGNFPAAVKVTAEYFPKKDRAYATSIFNAGATIGALIAPLTIPSLARYFQKIGVGNGWEMAFLIIGGLGFIWMGLWMFVYKKPHENPKVNQEELKYIEQDNTIINNPQSSEQSTGQSTRQSSEQSTFNNTKLTLLQCFKYRQTWAVFLSKLVTDCVWWFFLFWTPAYLFDVYGLSADSSTAQLLIFVLYAITMLSIFGGKLPSIIVNRTGKNPYAARMKAMLIFAIIPLFTVLAQPLGTYSYWFPIILIGLAGAAHQSWSANLYSVIGDMFPKSTIATITGINGLAGGISSFAINIISGKLFDYADITNMTFMGFEGKPAGYFIIFCYCAIAYILGWAIMKLLVPEYKLIDIKK